MNNRVAVSLPHMRAHFATEYLIPVFGCRTTGGNYRGQSAIALSAVFGCKYPCFVQFRITVTEEKIHTVPSEMNTRTRECWFFNLSMYNL